MVNHATQGEKCPKNKSRKLSYLGKITLMVWKERIYCVKEQKYDSLVDRSQSRELSVRYGELE